MEIAPALQNVPFLMPFYIPDGYFDTLSSIIMERVKIETTEELSVLLNGISKENLYKIPEGYFENLSGEIISKLHLSVTDELPANLLSTSRENIYQVPDGYFEKLPSIIWDSVSEQDLELKFSKANVYVTLTGYFESLPTIVLDRIAEQNLESKFSKENVYSAPANYFDNLSNNILDKINKEQEASIPQGYFESLPDLMLNKIKGLEVKEELEEVAPFLNTISKKPVNHIPEGYFGNLGAKPGEKEQAQTKVVSIKKKSAWFTYVAAACLLGVIAFTALKLNTKTNSETTGLAQIPLVDTTVKINDELAKVDDAAIESYLKANELVADAFVVNSHPVKDEDIESFLKEFSEEELQQYLKTEGEAPMVTNN